MNRRCDPPAADVCQLALAAVGACLREPISPQLPHWPVAGLREGLAALRTASGPQPDGLVLLANRLGLSDAELMALALAAAVELDAAAARAVAAAQAPLGASRPLVGLAARAFATAGASPLGLASGVAVASGALVLGDEPAALPERSLRVPLPLLAACRELVADFPGARRRVPAAMALPRDLAASADRWAAALADRTGAGLVVRSPSRPEAVALAARVAGQLGLGLAEVCDNAPGLGPWLIAARLAPLWLPTLGAGAVWRRPEIGHYSGPWFAAAPPEGTIESEPPAADWCVAVPTVPERELLWRAAGLCAPEAARAAASYRQGAGRIAEVAARARQLAATRGAPAPAWSDLTRAVVGGSAGLDARARHSPAEVEEDALVLPAALRRAMRDLVARARLRDRLHADLGPAVTARYRPGLRALFVGESGTGKTLAAHWFAGRLGLPLYRVDLAALTSKWIGETEKNLSEVLGAAEHADAVLLFDEADALFAARTDISDAHDRHANAQTNYLLQRIEEFDGIALLASNSRTRFDPAFVRRLDAILDFPMPEAPARAELWRAHLGQRHGLSPAEIDRLAVAVDIAGGHIRNAVLAAAARALGREAAIGWVEVSAAVAEEYAKLGRPAPHLGP